MRRRPRLAPLCWIVALALAVPGSAAAQAIWRVGVGGGAFHASLVDPTSSDLRYSGGGPAVALTLGRETPGSVLDLRADYQGSRLSSALTSGDLPHERAFIAGLEVRRLREGWAVGGGRLRAGAALRGELALRDHWYAEPQVAFSYMIGAVGLGPAAAWTRKLGRGELRADALLPLASIVYRPYSDMESVEGAGVHLRLAALDRLQAPAGGVAWALPLGGSAGRMRAVAGWRFHYLRYRDHTVYREARQTLSVALELPLGGRP